MEQLLAVVIDGGGHSRIHADVSTGSVSKELSLRFSTFVDKTLASVENMELEVLLFAAFLAPVHSPKMSGVYILLEHVRAILAAHERKSNELDACR